MTWTMGRIKATRLSLCFLRNYCYDVILNSQLDNVSYHKSAAVMAFLSLYEHRMRIVWLPPYCSHLNSIEHYWRHFKDAIAANAKKMLLYQNQPDPESRFHLSKKLLVDYLTTCQPHLLGAVFKPRLC